MKLKIGIVGSGGMVGSTMTKWFRKRKKYKKGKNLFLYDINPDLGHNDDVNKADIVVICVPTPPDDSGGCDTTIVEKAVSRLRAGMVVVIKSTVVPGTTMRLAKKFPDKMFLMSPEYLTEKYRWEDFVGVCGRQIVAHTGGESIAWAKALLDILPLAAFMCPWGSDYDQREMEATEAEMAKYFANIFGAHTVVFSNIIQDMCHAMEVVFAHEDIEGRVDYERIRECVSADPRIGPSWKNVNHGKYRGFGGFCFPKDLLAFIIFMEDLMIIIKQYRISHGDHGEKTQLLLDRIEAGLNVMKAVWDYNELLLEQQGLSVEEVSIHDKELKKKLKNVKRLAPEL